MENRHEIREPTGIFNLKQIIDNFCSGIKNEHIGSERNFETSEKTDGIAGSIVGCEYYLEKH